MGSSDKLPSCIALWRGHSTSGARVSRGLFSSSSSSLSLELLSLSESEELSDSLLSDSPLLECAEATGSGSVCGALQSNGRIPLEGHAHRISSPITSAIYLLLDSKGIDAGLSSSGQRGQGVRIVVTG